MLRPKKDEDEVVAQDETAESSECWRRVGRLEGELQQARDQLERRENELKDLRIELQSKDSMIKEMDQKAVEWGKGLASNAEKLEQECSNKVQRLQELEFVNEALKQRRNELEKLLDESALEVNKIQKRHDEQLEEMQSQLDHGRQKLLDENKKLRET